MNLASLVLDRASSAPAAVAVIAGSKSLTYGELADESYRVAMGLRDLGVAPGDRVMMFSSNNVEYLVTYLATARLGAIFAPVHASFQASELEYILANSSPTAIVTETHLWKRLQRLGTALPDIQIVVDKARGKLTSFDDLGRTSSGPLEPVAVANADPCLICYTSGTTDRPHPVTRSHAVEVWNAQTYAQVFDYHSSDRALVALPLSWVWGLTTLALALLSTGATVILQPEFEPDEVLREIERSGVTLFAGTMSMYTALLASLSENSYDISSIRRLYRGGEPINDEVVMALEARVGLKLTDAYATTEVAPVIAVDPIRDVHRPSGTAGRLVPGAKIRLVNEDGKDVPRGEVGEAWLGGPGTMLGYWNEPELTSQRLNDGWFRSGDLLVEGVDGYYFVVGRSADVIIRNGAKIAPAEVESAITSLPGVRDCIAVGVPDEEFGESIVTFVMLDEGFAVSVDDVYDHLSDRIARFKLPSHIYFVEDFPLRLNEKRDRASIRQQALAAVHGEVGALPSTAEFEAYSAELRIAK